MNLYKKKLYVSVYIFDLVKSEHEPALVRKREMMSMIPRSERRPVG